MRFNWYVIKVDLMTHRCQPATKYFVVFIKKTIALPTPTIIEKYLIWEKTARRKIKEIKINFKNIFFFCGENKELFNFWFEN